MHIDRIVMQNFKSFAGRASIPFPRGFTVICGPNGSGKSNISDAFTFVLGTSSAKSIRAKRLHNLIFNGGKKRKPAEFCEVSLYLKEGEKETKITRKINKSGVSVYKINGKNVTKSKMVETLTNYNLSPDGYNVIAQGDVARVIEMSPLERRGVIDDISGISEFDEKKMKSEKELERVETRIREGMIVISEKQRMVDRLKREKENAEKFVELEAKHKKLKASILKKKREDLESQIGKISLSIEEKDNSLKQVTQGFETEEKEIENAEKRIEELNNEIIKKSTAHELMKETDQTRNEILRKRDKIDMNQKEIERLEEITRRLVSLSGREGTAVKEVLKLQDDKIIGTIASLIDVPPKYATAVKTAIGNHLNDIVVSDQNTAIKYVKHLKKNKLGSARFIPLDKIKFKEKSDHNPGGNIHGYAIDIIGFDDQYRNAVGYALGNTVVVTQVDDVRKIKGRAVTLDGDLKESAGAMVGGFYREKQKSEAPDYQGEINKLKGEIPALEKEINELEQKLAQLEASKEKESQEVKNMQAEKGDIEQKIEGIKASRKEFYEKRLALQSEINKQRIEKAKIEAKMDNIVMEADQFKDVQEFVDDEIPSMEQQAQECIKQINELGPINMKAIDEFKTVNVEFLKLKERLDSLLEEKHAVQEVINDIEKRRYSKFMETLNDISERFGAIYKELTEGEAGLKLEEKDNIDSGMVIEATPKGKKLIILDAMSGGEKALTSLAFLFAIQQRYGSPFYLLDEIDAPLDKANTRRVVNMIKKHAQNMQFIIVSHNDTTMTEAETLFGVAMEEGVSKIFGIRMPATDQSADASENTGTQQS